MNPALTEVSVASRWMRPGLALLAALLALFVLFWPTFLSMVQIWERSETFAHGYLIFPISLWLIWRRRDVLAALSPRTDLRGLLAFALAAAGWLLADAGSVSVVEQYAFIAMLIASVWAVLGWGIIRALLFPLLFLFFAVPTGEFLTEPLMEITADFTVALLQLTGIPVYREGLFFSIPSGNWSVVEACSGLRYLIASVTLGLLYAYLTYRSWKRRVLFTIAAIIVPILANSGRAFMIVMIGHLSGMRLAMGVDHYIYGWVFFGLVMLLLFWIGSFWREDDQPEPPAAPVSDAPQTSRIGALPMTATLAVVAVLAPLYLHWLASRPLPSLPALAVQASAGWQPATAFTSWTPHWVGADRQARQVFVQGDAKIFLELNYYATQRQDAELVNSQNFMIRQKDPHWSNVGERLRQVEIDGKPHPVRQARMRGADGQRLLVWQWNRVNGAPTVNDKLAKLALAFDRVRGARDDATSVLIATPYDDSQPGAAEATLARFAAEMQPAIAQALATVEAP